jgi:hypothetical protein
MWIAASAIEDDQGTQIGPVLIGSCNSDAIAGMQDRDDELRA